MILVLFEIQFNDFWSKLTELTPKQEISGLDMSHSAQIPKKNSKKWCRLSTLSFSWETSKTEKWKTKSNPKNFRGNLISGFWRVEAKYKTPNFLKFLQTLVLGSEKRRDWKKCEKTRNQSLLNRKKNNWPAVVHYSIFGFSAVPRPVPMVSVRFQLVGWNFYICWVTTL